MIKIPGLTEMVGKPILNAIDHSVKHGNTVDEALLDVFLIANGVLKLKMQQYGLGREQAIRALEICWEEE